MVEGSGHLIVIAVAACGAASAIVDLKTRRVPNPLTGGIAATGVTLAALQWSGLSVAGAVAGLLLGLFLMLPGYVLGATGGGDVKLFAATGTLLGPKLVLVGFAYTLIAGGLIALLVAARRRRVRESVRGAAQIVTTAGTNVAELEHPSTNNRFAYAPAIAIGTLAAALGI